jgi:hypothetical protein
MDNITICYSTHRSETLSLTARIIENFDVIILEEPPHKDFSNVLNGTIDIKEHLLELDVGYPAFTAGQYRLLQEFHRSGKQIRQIEPYLEELLGIQYFFADGNDPEEIETGTVAHSVYIAERDATGALIEYYKEVRGDNFLKILSTMNSFAKADAARFILRDALRAKRILRELTRGKDTYIEAGSIHLLLQQLIADGLRENQRLNIHSIDTEVLSILGDQGNLFGPGDELTLGYISGQAIDEQQWQLLCSQALIYSKIIRKEEMSSEDFRFPHTRNELETISIVKELSVASCEKLFKRIRSLPSEQAAKIVRNYNTNQSLQVRA